MQWSSARVIPAPTAAPFTALDRDEQRTTLILASQSASFVTVWPTGDIATSGVGIALNRAAPPLIVTGKLAAMAWQAAGSAGGLLLSVLEVFDDSIKE